MTKTVKCRIALCINAQGEWAASGWSDGDEAALIRVAREGCPGAETNTRYWVEVAVPVPVVATVQGVAVHEARAGGGAKEEA